MTILTPHQLTDRFLDMGRETVVQVDVGGRDPLHVKVSPSSNKNAKSLLILFHGALARSKGAEVPAFLNRRRALGGMAHQISIADPGVRPDNTVGIGWFAGSEVNPAQRLLPAFFEHLRSALCPERLVFVGSSAGGYGALFYSWHVPGSIVCASVPQTNIRLYADSAWKRYLKQCWPSESGEPGENAPLLDLRELYSTGVPNTVVYVQSILDRRSVFNHMQPFVGAIPVEDQDKLALKVSYWGRPGHSGAVPPGELDGWIKAAVDAEDPSADGIVRHYQASGVERTPLSEAMMLKAGVARTPMKSAASQESQESRYQDLIWAKAVAESQLKGN